MKRLFKFAFITVLSWCCFTAQAVSTILTGADKYIFVKPAVTNGITGVIMGRNADYRRMRSEDIAWLTEALSERYHLMNGVSIGTFSNNVLRYQSGNWPVSITNQYPYHVLKITESGETNVIGRWKMVPHEWPSHGEIPHDTVHVYPFDRDDIEFSNHGVLRHAQGDDSKLFDHYEEPLNPADRFPGYFDTTNRFRSGMFTIPDRQIRSRTYTNSVTYTYTPNTVSVTNYTTVPDPRASVYGNGYPYRPLLVPIVSTTEGEPILEITPNVVTETFTNYDATCFICDGENGPEGPHLVRPDFTFELKEGSMVNLSAITNAYKAVKDFSLLGVIGHLASYNVCSNGYRCYYTHSTLIDGKRSGSGTLTTNGVPKLYAYDYHLKQSMKAVTYRMMNDTVVEDGRRSSDQESWTSDVSDGPGGIHVRLTIPFKTVYTNCEGNVNFRRLNVSSVKGFFVFNGEGRWGKSRVNTSDPGMNETESYVTNFTVAVRYDSSASVVDDQYGYTHVLFDYPDVSAWSDQALRLVGFQYPHTDDIPDLPSVEYPPAPESATVSATEYQYVATAWASRNFTFSHAILFIDTNFRTNVP